MATEIICDTNVFYSYGSLDQLDSNEYLACYYNFQDLLMSKSNLMNLDSRLRTTISSKLKSINKHEVLIFEPHHYILQEIFPESKVGKILYDRVDKTEPTSYINVLSDILVNGNNCSPTSKRRVIELSEFAQRKNKENAEVIKKYANLLYKKIRYSRRDQVKYTDFIPYVEEILIDQLNNNYRKTHMLHTEEVTKYNLDFSKYELFINVYARYFSTLVGPEGQNPAHNDNIDTLILLYVTPERKFITREKKWIRYIKDVGLGHYLKPFRGKTT